MPGIERLGHQTSARDRLIQDSIFKQPLIVIA
jgi:hypothetical protein